jgi:hypothetical protein
VGDEVGFRAPGLPEQLGQSAEQLVVGNGLELVCGLHTDSISRLFATFWRASGARERGRWRAKALCGVARLVARLSTGHGHFRHEQVRRARALPKLVKGKVEEGPRKSGVQRE